MKKGLSFWSKAEEAGEAMEIGIRCLFGVLFTVFFSAFFYWLGSHAWSGIGIVLGIVSAPFGFIAGFFWMEIKFLLRLLIQYFTGL